MARSPAGIAHIAVQEAVDGKGITWMHESFVYATICKNSTCTFNETLEKCFKLAG
jgi:hypothetical protein